MYPKEIEKFLLGVQKPGRYTGGELNSIVKDKSKIDIRYAFCFPDTYEIGMSHLGMKILYSLVNARDDAWCERVFAPDVDMEQVMRDNGIPLYALESGEAIKDFDLIGFTMQYELSYTNVLNMLDLAGLPVRSRDRKDLTPIVIAGGACVCNAEPMAEFFDITLPGDGEEVTNELIDLLKEYKAKGATKHEFLEAAAQIKGVYVPSLYEVEYNDDCTVKSITPTHGAPEKVEKRNVADLDKMFAPTEFVVPFLEVVHDRTTVEIFRGCIRGCRFCQAGFLNRPLREKSPEVVEAQCRSICEKTGYDEISLCSLSTSDYRGLEKLITDMLPWTVENKINISLPSLRADNFPKELMEQLNAVRRSGLTFAPEAGTQRLRDVINKNITEEEVLSTARQAFAGGWTAVKLYFMIGLPTETEDDIRGIADLAQAVVDEFYHNENKPKGKGVNVSVSVASLVPKPFTPFQWEPQDRPDTLIEKQNFLISCVKTRKVSVSRHVPWTSFLEGVFARGDRRLCDVIETAWRKGCKFDSWEEHLDREKWMDSFAENGIDPFFYTARKRSFDEVLPWDHMDYGVTKKFLIKENEKAHRGETTASCREKCAGCGAARLNGGVCNEIRQNMV
ncbi:MAG: TIGR03960 family B12-binding radical SAM protein [Clostridium sp.]|nr:TIGR03960 family B12-binding radical SAM protein [Clostridium sp.]MDY5895925.1 TIGR03960 family B12-binding radical SAM protein [Oscillospiraceae bacterium]